MFGHRCQGAGSQLSSIKMIKCVKRHNYQVESKREVECNHIPPQEPDSPLVYRIEAVDLRPGPRKHWLRIVYPDHHVVARRKCHCDSACPTAKLEHAPTWYLQEACIELYISSDCGIET